MIEVKAKKKIATAMKTLPKAPICVVEGGLGERRAGQLRAGHERAGEEDHQRGRRADQDGVDEHAQGLDEALARGVVRLRHGAGRDVGGRAHAGLVGEEAALDAVEHGRGQAAGDAARRFLEAEGAHDDVAQHAGHLAEVHDQDDDGEQQVDAGHERHDHLGHLGDLADAAEDDDAGQRRDDEAGHQRRQAERALDGAGDRVGLHRVEDEAEGDDQAIEKMTAAQGAPRPREM